MTEQKYTIKLIKGMGNIITKNINGILDSIVLSVPNKTELKIISQAGYTIFESKEIEGAVYIPIRVQASDFKGHRISFSAEEYNLNEKLLISARTSDTNNKEIKIILRIK